MLLSPRWMGPFKVLARRAPNIYRLELPAAWRAFDEFNVERLRPYHHRPPRGGAAGPRPMVQELLKFKLRYCRPYLLVRWAGRDASGDTREPLDSLKDCAEAISAFERATGRMLSPQPCCHGPRCRRRPPPPRRRRRRRPFPRQVSPSDRPWDRAGPAGRSL